MKATIIENVEMINVRNFSEAQIHMSLCHATIERERERQREAESE